MKNKKFLLLCLSFLLLLALASCNPRHECSFDEEWKSDSVNHWHECECGAKNEEGAHTFGEWQPNGDSEESRECSLCGYKESKPVEGHVHDYSDIWSKDANNHWHSCSGCNVPGEKAEHSWNEGAVTSDPTCTESGVKTFTCEICNATRVEEIDKLSHSEEVVAGKEATCTEDGLTDGKKCSACGEILLVQETIPALGHDMIVDAAVDATCTESGLTEGSHCSRCDYEVAQEVVPALGHTEEIDAAVEADCINEGKTEGKHCSVCNEVLVAQEVVPALGHNIIVDAAVAPDCLNSGLTEGSHCSRCDYMVEQTFVSALGHKDDNTDYVCDVCKAALCNEHSPAEAVRENEIASTCTAGGSYDSVVNCSKCGHEISREKVSVPALGHTEEILPGKEVTCIESGLTEGKKCSVCGEILVAQEEIIAGGHNYADELIYDENNHWQLCGACGEKSELVPHEFNSGVIVDGKVVCTCSCGHTMENIWDGVSVSDSLSGSGTEEDPFLIQSGADLAYIDQNMTASENFKGVYFKMTRSIDLGNHSMKIGEYPGWGGRKIFSGIFDGNDCSIINLNMTESGKGGGLFSVVSGTVKNLTVYGNVKGDDLMTGGIVGWLYQGTLENCINYVNVISSASSETGAMIGTCQLGTVINCSNHGSVVGIDSVGGIAGKASGTLTNCQNYGSVSGCTNLGGIYGSVHSSGTPVLTDCNDSGTISAHSLTRHEAKSNSCEEAGNVEYYSCSVCGGNFDAEGNKLSSVEIAATGHAWDEGVLSNGVITFTCGNCGGTKQESAVYTVTVNHIYLDGTAAANADEYEYAYGESYTVNAKAIEGYVASHDYVKGQVDDNVTVTIYYSVVDVWDGISISESLSGSGTEEDPYLIQSGADLAYFAQVVNGHNVEGTFTKDHTSREVYTVYSGVYFKLTKSIDLNGNLLKIGYSLAWNKYSRFGGNFDGNNCSIRGINITADDSDRNDALFGMVYVGVIKNLSTYGNVYGGGVLNGGVVGYLVSGTVENCTSYVVIEGAKETGGIVGNLEKGSVINCTNYGKVTCTDTTTGGAVVGKNASGTVTDCISFTELNV